MGRALDLTNQKVNALTALERNGKDNNNKSLWLCRCDCGKEIIVRGSDFKRGHYKSCGCSRTINEQGNKYNKLLVVAKNESKSEKNTYWLCKCDCGNPNLTSVKGTSLRDGSISSCGLCNNVIDEVGKIYGKLTVLSRDWKHLTGDGAYWICRCECGSMCSVLGTNLRKQITKSCGCLNSKGELKIKELLTNIPDITFIQQYTFTDLKDKASLKFDFAIFQNNNLIALLEYQGEQHYFLNRSFHKDEQKFFDGLYKDQLKESYCLIHGLKLVKIPYWDYQKLSQDYLKELIL